MRVRRSGRANTVMDTVVRSGICVGCGVCAAVCPTEALSLGFTRLGEYSPTLNPAACNGCGLCLSVCPFSNSACNEDVLASRLYGNTVGIEHRSECGFFISSYARFSLTGDQRERGASGGLATWTLTRLLQRGDVDAVIAVRPNPDPECLFNYSIASSATDLSECSGSAYYPVELSQALRAVLTSNARFAVIGLPCFIKALRLAASYVPALERQMTACLGLTCQALQSRFFAEYLTTLAGGDPSLVEKLQFRDKRPGCSARDSYLSYWYTTDSSERGVTARTPWTRLPCQAFGRQFFCLRACDHCDDVFAECADAVFMDAWLPEYEADPRGHSLVLARTKHAAELVEAGIQDQQISGCHVPIEKLLASQQQAVRYKREQLQVRLALRGKHGLYVPSKRVVPLRAGCRDLLRQALSDYVHCCCRKSWARSRNRGRLALRLFYIGMPAHAAIQGLNRIKRVCSRLFRTLRMRGTEPA